MGLFKRGELYWFEFVHNGKRYQRSTGVRNQREARQIEATVRGDLAKGEVGIVERKKAPTLQVFSKVFMTAIEVRSAEKPASSGRLNFAKSCARAEITQLRKRQRVSVRRCQRLSREIFASCAPSGSPDSRGQSRKSAAPLRARLLGPAPPPEGGGGRTGGESA